jgi:hypothetical protein
MPNLAAALRLKDSGGSGSLSLENYNAWLAANRVHVLEAFRASASDSQSLWGALNNPALIYPVSSLFVPLIIGAHALECSQRFILYTALHIQSCSRNPRYFPNHRDEHPAER